MRSAVAEVSEGSVVDGRYRVLRRIGSGGMADVWLAEDTHLQRQVALKVLHRALRPGPRVRRALPARGRGARPASSTPTSSPSSTAATSRAPTTSRCSYLEGPLAEAADRRAASRPSRRSALIRQVLEARPLRPPQRRSSTAT